jgi:hypothetical protein
MLIMCTGSLTVLANVRIRPIKVLDYLSNVACPVHIKSMQNNF